MASCLVFLKANEIFDPVNLNADAWEALTLDVAPSKLDRGETTRRLAELI